MYPVMNVPPEAIVTKLVLEAAANLDHDIELHTSGGGCDANFINEKGIECVNLGNGNVRASYCKRISSAR